ncbi:MAG: DUF2029 domain-containing protein [Acidobacteria bacterium]|nr:DUF2029 domain-containing protein [Acidobacteriota bacterium]
MESLNAPERDVAAPPGGIDRVSTPTPAGEGPPPGPNPSLDGGPSGNKAPTPLRNVLRRDTAFRLLLVLLLFLPALLTLGDYGVTWDEPIYQAAADEIRQWFREAPGSLLSEEAIRRRWDTDPARNVHPSGVKLLYVAAGALFPWVDDPFTRNRALNALLFAVAASTFLFWRHRGKVLTAALSAVVLMTVPRFFAHLHFAATDLPMTSLLLLLVVAAHRVERPSRAVACGVLLGLLACVKITGAVLGVAVLLGRLAIARGDRAGVLRRCLVAAAVSLAVFYVLNPNWWFSPMETGRWFVGQSVGRLGWAPIATWFGGQFYPARCPAHYPFTVFWLTTPLLHVVAVCAGAVAAVALRAVRRGARTALLLPMALLPFLLMVLPFSPTNDGERYLLPAYPFLAELAVLGAVSLPRRLARRARVARTLPPRLKTALALPPGLLLVVLGAAATATTHPYQLSYYASQAGGLGGAAAAGYEVSYWWDPLNDRNLAALDRHCRGRRVYWPFAPDERFFVYAIRAGKVRFLPVGDPRGADFVLLYSRPYLAYWEAETAKELAALGRRMERCWEVRLQGVPLLSLHRVVAPAPFPLPTRRPPA